MQAGADVDITNRFGETPSSILDNGKSGKWLPVFQQSNAALSSADLERLEAEHRSAKWSSVNSLLSGDTHGKGKSCE